MKTYPVRRPRKVAFILVSLLLLIAVVALSVFIIHKPRALWKIIASVNLNLPPTPTASERFNTLPPGSKLPSESECAARVRRYAWEPRPDNTTANLQVKYIYNKTAWPMSHDDTATTHVYDIFVTSILKQAILAVP